MLLGLAGRAATNYDARGRASLHMQQEPPPHQHEQQPHDEDRLTGGSSTIESGRVTTSAATAAVAATAAATTASAATPSHEQQLPALLQRHPLNQRSPLHAVAAAAGTAVATASKRSADAADVAEAAGALPADLGSSSRSAVRLNGKSAALDRSTAVMAEVTCASCDAASAAAAAAAADLSCSSKPARTSSKAAVLGGFDVEQASCDSALTAAPATSAVVVVAASPVRHDPSEGETSIHQPSPQQQQPTQAAFSKSVGGHPVGIIPSPRTVPTTAVEATTAPVATTSASSLPTSTTSTKVPATGEPSPLPPFLPHPPSSTSSSACASSSSASSSSAPSAKTTMQLNKPDERFGKLPSHGGRSLPLAAAAKASENQRETSQSVLRGKAAGVGVVSVSAVGGGGGGCSISGASCEQGGEFEGGLAAAGSDALAASAVEEGEGRLAGSSVVKPAAIFVAQWQQQEQQQQQQQQHEVECAPSKGRFNQEEGKEGTAGAGEGVEKEGQAETQAEKEESGDEGANLTASVQEGKETVARGGTASEGERADLGQGKSSGERTTVEMNASSVPQELEDNGKPMGEENSKPVGEDANEVADDAANGGEEEEEHLEREGQQQCQLPPQEGERRSPLVLSARQQAGKAAPVRRLVQPMLPLPPSHPYPSLPLNGPLPRRPHLHLPLPRPSAPTAASSPASFSLPSPKHALQLGAPASLARPPLCPMPIPPHPASARVVRQRRSRNATRRRSNVHVPAFIAAAADAADGDADGGDGVPSSPAEAMTGHVSEHSGGSGDEVGRGSDDAEGRACEGEEEELSEGEDGAGHVERESSSEERSVLRMGGLGRLSRDSSLGREFQEGVVGKPNLSGKDQRKRARPEEGDERSGNLCGFAQVKVEHDVGTDNGGVLKDEDDEEGKGRPAREHTSSSKRLLHPPALLRKSSLGDESALDSAGVDEGRQGFLERQDSGGAQGKGMKGGGKKRKAPVPSHRSSAAAPAAAGTAGPASAAAGKSEREEALWRGVSRVADRLLSSSSLGAAQQQPQHQQQQHQQQQQQQLLVLPPANFRGPTYSSGRPGKLAKSAGLMGSGEAWDAAVPLAEGQDERADGAGMEREKGGKGRGRGRPRKGVEGEGPCLRGEDDDEHGHEHNGGACRMQMHEGGNGCGTAAAPLHSRSRDHRDGSKGDAAASCEAAAVGNTVGAGRSERGRAASAAAAAVAAAATGGRVIRSRRVQERVARAEEEREKPGGKAKAVAGGAALYLKVTLSKDEINADFLAIHGHKSSARPKKSLIPSLGLALCANLSHPHWNCY